MKADVLFGIEIGAAIASIVFILVGIVILLALIKDRDLEERKLNSDKYIKEKQNEQTR